jgi:hypothetical protein
MKKVTSVTVWNDSAGYRISVTYSVVDEKTRKVTADNIRENFVLSDDDEIATAAAVTALAQTILNEAEA